jgi:hypothetical protein
MSTSSDSSIQPAVDRAPPPTPPAAAAKRELLTRPSELDALAFARCSPGLLMMRETIRHAACLGLRRFEMLGIADPWLDPWAGEVRQRVAARIYPRGTRAALALAASTTVHAMRSVGGR